MTPNDELSVFAPQVDSPKLMALRLREHCDVMGWTINNNRGGAKEFAKLIHEHGEHVVWDRLLAYIRYRITKPDVHSGHDFRCYWNWIGDEVAKRRELEPPVKLTPVAKEILTELSNHPWHETAKTQLPAVVTHSLNNLNAFIAKLRVASVDNSVRDQILPELEPVRFLTMWFRNVWDRYKKFDAWTGNLQPSIWTHNHKDFTAFAKRILVKWAGHDDGSWKRLIESLNAKEKS